MSATTAVTETAHGRLGVMVRTPTELFVYWHPGGRSPAGVLRVTDLSGRPAPELLDGSGRRDIPLAGGQSSLYISDLPPGHLYFVELGEVWAEGFTPLVGAGPVQTPWREMAGDLNRFPAPYHRS